MQCPYCSSETKVLESRTAEDGMRRRRECLQCENRFTTYEKAAFHFYVRKKDGREEPYQLEKLHRSIQRALGKEEGDDSLEMAKKVEQKILLRKKNPIRTTEIGRLVLRELRRQDKMAYVRFASIHKAIEDPRLLRKEIQLVA